MKKLILVGLLLILSSVAPSAQTSILAWEHNGVNVTAVNAYSFTLKIDAANPVAITASCATAGVNVACTSPIAPLSSGSHSLILTATNTMGSASSTLSGSAPVPAVNIKVVITVSVP